ncbi:thaumatin-like protein [Mycena leptocephala]|nr:thaumatin-like protein [Mycena leptocephala]
MKSFITVSLAMVSGVVARSITVYNGCPFTICFLILPQAGEIVCFVPVRFMLLNSAQFGRIWARRNCDFSKTSGPTSCLDGGCLGGLVCDVSAGTGVPPASLAEALCPTSTTVGAHFNRATLAEITTVSFVDGYNLPIRIDNDAGCPAPGCNVDLGPNCPASQKGPFDASGFPVGCSSSCNIDALNGRAGNSPNCCSGQFDKPETCPSSGDACPNAYAYAYDESSESALWTCPTPKKADYTVTFCP